MRTRLAEITQEAEDIARTGKEITQEKQHAEVDDVEAAQTGGDSFDGRMSGLKTES